MMDFMLNCGDVEFWEFYTLSYCPSLKDVALDRIILTPQVVF